MKDKTIIGLSSTGVRHYTVLHYAANATSNDHKATMRYLAALNEGLK